MTSITIYDGAESIGGNKIYVENKGRGVFLDFGTNFSKTAMFFSDFLQNRTSRGIKKNGKIPILNMMAGGLSSDSIYITMTGGYWVGK